MHGAKAGLLVSMLAAFAVRPGAQSVPPAPAADTLTIRVREGTALTFDLSPDGRSIVIDLLGQLWELPVDGGSARPLTDAVRDTADDRQPAVSPDGRWIATRSDRPRGRGIWLHARDGGVHRPLTDSSLILGDDVGVPAWAPDGRRLAYVRQGAIWLIDTVGGTPAKLGITGQGDAFDEPSWSPDGTRFAVSGPWRGGSARSLLEGPPGAPIWEVDIASGTPRRITPEGVAARAPAWSPDGMQLAWFAADSAGGYRLEVQPLSGSPRTVAREPGIEPRRVRWSRDGTALYFVAAGRIHRVSLSGGASAEVPFTAELRIARATYARAPLRFPEPGSIATARGFSGLALAPDGSRIAMLALGRLWLISDRGAARAVATVPPFAYGLAWSPDGRQVAWTALSDSAEDIWVTEVSSGASRKLTALPGEEGRPAWSPDGRWIAFLHWPRSGHQGAPWAGADDNTYLRIADASLSHPITLQDTRVIGVIPWGELSAFALTTQWTPGGDAVLMHGMGGWPVASRRCAEAVLYRPDSTQHKVTRFPCRPGHLVLGPDGSLVDTERGEVVRHAPAADGWGDAESLGTGAALYPSLARDGSLLFVAPDGLRLRRPDGAERRLGWPVTYRAPTPRPLLVRNVRLAALEPGADSGLRDLLISDGKFRRITPAGTLRGREAAGAEAIDAEGRWAIPGLIDVHGHLGDGMASIRGALYHGVTVLREMWHPLGESAAARDAVNSGAAPGARVVVSGPPVYPTPTGAAITNDFLWIPVDSTTTERGLAMLAGFGAGHVKMRYVQSWSGAGPFVRAAHRYGLSVSGHCAHALTLVAAGIDGHEHLDGQCGDWEFGVRDDIVQLYRAAGVAVTPVIDYHDEIVRTADDTARIHAPNAEPFVTPALRLDALWAPLSPAARLRVGSRAARARESTRRMSAAGVRIGLGSDASMYPGGVPRELQALVAAGLTPRDALRAATADAAAVLGAGDQLGRIAPGYLADLVLLEGDPLADIGNVRRIRTVIQGGRVVDREGLRRALAPGVVATPQR